MKYFIVSLLSIIVALGPASVAIASRRNLVSGYYDAAIDVPANRESESFLRRVGRNAPPAPAPKVKKIGPDATQIEVPENRESEEFFWSLDGISPPPPAPKVKEMNRHGLSLPEFVVDEQVIAELGIEVPANRELKGWPIGR